MVKSRNHIFTVIGVFMVLVTLLVLSPERSYAPPPAQDVNVVNTPSVDVGTPDVSVVNPVEIGSQPINVKNVDKPAFQPFSAGVFLDMDSDQETRFEEIATVPTDQRLVVEYIDVSANIPASTPLLAVRLELTTGGTTNFHFVSFPDGVETADITGPHKVYAFGALTRLYADPDSAVTIGVIRDGSGDVAPASARISGYFVDIE